MNALKYHWCETCLFSSQAVLKHVVSKNFIFKKSVQGTSSVSCQKWRNLKHCSIPKIFHAYWDCISLLSNNLLISSFRFQANLRMSAAFFLYIVMLHWLHVKRKLQHVGHKWVMCGSHPDCSVGQWVTWVNRNLEILFVHDLQIQSHMWLSKRKPA